MKNKNVLVTGIGGNVGQGILRNIIAEGLPIDIYGCNTIEFSAGNHFCLKTFKVPFAFDVNYIEEIISIVKENEIDLIIPSTDHEVFYLSKHREAIPCNIAVSGSSRTWRRAVPVYTLANVGAAGAAGSFTGTSSAG